MPFRVYQQIFLCLPLKGALQIGTPLYHPQVTCKVNLVGSPPLPSFKGSLISLHINIAIPLILRALLLKGILWIACPSPPHHTLFPLEAKLVDSHSFYPPRIQCKGRWEIDPLQGSLKGDKWWMWVGRARFHFGGKQKRIWGWVFLGSFKKKMRKERVMGYPSLSI